MSKNVTILDLPPIATDTGFSPGTGLVPFQADSILSAEERGIITELDKQITAIAAMKHKTLRGQHDTAELQRSTVETFAETLD